MLASFQKTGTKNAVFYFSYISSEVIPKVGFGMISLILSFDIDFEDGETLLLMKPECVETVFYSNFWKLQNSPSYQNLPTIIPRKS